MSLFVSLAPALSQPYEAAGWPIAEAAMSYVPACLGFQPPSDSAKNKEIKTEKWRKWVRNDIWAERMTARSFFFFLLCTFPLKPDCFIKDFVKDILSQTLSGVNIIPISAGPG